MLELCVCLTEGEVREAFDRNIIYGNLNSLNPCLQLLAYVCLRIQNAILSIRVNNIPKKTSFKRCKVFLDCFAYLRYYWKDNSTRLKCIGYANNDCPNRYDKNMNTFEGNEEPTRFESALNVTRILLPQYRIFENLPIVIWIETYAWDQFSF